MSLTPLSQMRIYELRNKLKEKGLSSSGTKSDLISRLTEYFNENEEEVCVQEVKDHIQVDSPSFTQEIESNTSTLLQSELAPNPAPLSITVESVVNVTIPVPQEAVKDTEKVTKVLVSEALLFTKPEQIAVVTSVKSEEQPSKVSNGLTFGQSILEDRCKRFGIPFDASKLANSKQVAATPATKKEEFKQSLESRKRRFGLEGEVKVENMDDKKRNQQQQQQKQQQQQVRLLSVQSEDDKKKMEARMKRFGLL